MWHKWQYDDHDDGKTTQNDQNNAGACNKGKCAKIWKIKK